MVNVSQLRAQPTKVGLEVFDVILEDALTDDGREAVSFVFLLNELTKVSLFLLVMRAVSRLPVVNVVRVNGLVLLLATLKLVLGYQQLVNVLKEKHKQDRGVITPLLTYCCYSLRLLFLLL